MYISVPRAHHRTVFWRRSFRVRDVDAEGLLAKLAEVSRAGTGLRKVGIEAGQGFGTLGRYSVSR